MTESYPLTPIHREPILGRGAWQSSDFKAEEDYILDLTSYLPEIDRILPKLREAFAANNRPEPADLPPTELEPLFRFVREELQSGRGFVLLRGLGAGNYSELDLSLVYQLFGGAIGKPESQNPAGDLLGIVEDLSWKTPQVRGYTSRERLTYHTDNSDVVGLMCIRSAKAGGETLLASALTLHNIMLDECPELLEALYAGYHYNYGKEGYGPSVTEHRIPVFSNIDGVVSARVYWPLAEEGMAKAGTPFEERDHKARKAFDDICARIALRHVLEPGEFVLFNNYTTLHARTDFEDYDDVDRRRRLLRLWLNREGFRKVHPVVRSAGANYSDAKEKVAI